MAQIFTLLFVVFPLENLPVSLLLKQWKGYAQIT